MLLWHFPIEDVITTVIIFNQYAQSQCVPRSPSRLHDIMFTKGILESSWCREELDLYVYIDGGKRRERGVSWWRQQRRSVWPVDARTSSLSGVALKSPTSKIDPVGARLLQCWASSWICLVTHRIVVIGKSWSVKEKEAEFLDLLGLTWRWRKSGEPRLRWVLTIQRGMSLKYRRAVKYLCRRRKGKASLATPFLLRLPLKMTKYTFFLPSTTKEIQPIPLLLFK